MKTEDGREDCRRGSRQTAGGGGGSTHKGGKRGRKIAGGGGGSTHEEGRWEGRQQGGGGGIQKDFLVEVPCDGCGRLCEGGGQ